MQRVARAVSASPLPIQELQLATLVDRAPDGPQWLHEQKFDGYRILADKQGDRVRLSSRRFKDWTGEFPSIAAAIAKLPVERVVLDGEVCVVMPDGRTSFQALQGSFGTSGANLVYYVFDLLAIDDEVLTALPLEQRKQRLAKLLETKPGMLRYSDHVIGHGAEFFALACKQGLEGIISKRRDKGYIPGRGKTWLKTKCWLRQELVIGGFTDPEGSRNGFGALLVGYYDHGKLVYAGKVGTGFSMKVLAELHRSLAAIEQAASPFDPAPAKVLTGPRHWVAPQLVAEIVFAEWTQDGRLRHPSFVGLRADKAPHEIVREVPS
jgi:bifunctional non-homologous end joining protein LigD